MKKTEKEIIQLLLSTQDWMTARQLSLKMNISVRTVKSYIKNINEVITNGIVSSHSGYKGNFETLNTALSTAEKQRQVISSQEDRVVLILKKIIDSNQEIDLYELADFFFVSESTMKNDLNMAKQLASKRNLNLIFHKNKIYLNGKEKDKRMLINDFLSSEVGNSLFNFEKLSQTINNERFEKIREVVINTFSEFKFYTNDYLLNNIVMHISIAITRMNQKSFLEQNDNSILKTDNFYAAATQIAQQISKTFKVNYERSELLSLAILIQSSVNEINFTAINETQLGQLIDSQTTNLIVKIISALNENYYINLNVADFKVRFSLHINNLITRLKNNISVKNPIKSKIKKECPLIYDCAVSVASIIEEETSYQISEDEIAYLSFHLGYAIEVKQQNQEKITCCLLSPAYYNMNKEILDRLTRLYSDDIIIKQIITDEADLSHLKTDLIISTIDLTSNPSFPQVRINPFISKKDREVIEQKINIIQKEKYAATLKKDLQFLMKKDLFWIKGQQINQEEVIQKICTFIEKQGYCDSDYVNKVRKRESLSATAFGKIAIPHSTNMEGIKSCLAVFINPNGIQWQKNTVYIVMLLCINPEDKNLYHEIFDKLGDLLIDEAIVDKLKNSNNYDDFFDKLVTLF